MLDATATTTKCRHSVSPQLMKLAHRSMRSIELSKRVSTSYYQKKKRGCLQSRDAVTNTAWRSTTPFRPTVASASAHSMRAKYPLFVTRWKGKCVPTENSSASEVVVVLGPGSIGQAVARRVGVPCTTKRAHFEQNVAAAPAPDVAGALSSASRGLRSSASSARRA